MSACSNSALCMRDPKCEDKHCPGRPSYGTPTVRRHPRSLADAFPEVRRQSFEPHVKPSFWHRVRLFFKRNFA